ncbi:unnamed protein product [Cyclocybe aegerita]|uniref:Uncharacterized protein n=1 Tax=Cyclocybe aegerita TaxID=1973307 RepID=A0A8S0XXZ1_CYCAE|nr:unnamed protein product [Cyclocybe aegerita]
MSLPNDPCDLQSPASPLLSSPPSALPHRHNEVQPEPLPAAVNSQAKLPTAGVGSPQNQSVDASGQLVFQDKSGHSVASQPKVPVAVVVPQTNPNISDTCTPFPEELERGVYGTTVPSFYVVMRGITVGIFDTQVGAMQSIDSVFENCIVRFSSWEGAIFDYTVCFEAGLVSIEQRETNPSVALLSQLPYYIPGTPEYVLEPIPLSPRPILRSPGHPSNPIYVGSTCPMPKCPIRTHIVPWSPQPLISTKCARKSHDSDNSIVYRLAKKLSGESDSSSEDSSDSSIIIPTPDGFYNSSEAGQPIVCDDSSSEEVFPFPSTQPPRPSLPHQQNATPGPSNHSNALDLNAPSPQGSLSVSASPSILLPLLDQHATDNGYYFDFDDKDGLEQLDLADALAAAHGQWPF